jgi:hypothetical protein
MVNWTGTKYNSLEELESAIEAIANSVTIHITGPDISGRFLLVQSV